MLKRYPYSDTITNFLAKSDNEIRGALTNDPEFGTDPNQITAWNEEIRILKGALQNYPTGKVYFEYDIPRMGRRIDVLAIIHGILFVLEFKVGEKRFNSDAIDQVCDYALDLANFHTTSQGRYIVPVLIATDAEATGTFAVATSGSDKVLRPILINEAGISAVIEKVVEFCGEQSLDYPVWENGRYCPTPTILEAALSLYNHHSVENIARNDAGATNLAQTSTALGQIIEEAHKEGQKIICFVTGVPGAGKTLVGLNIATKNFRKEDDLYSVFLSGNGPLVKILCEALARDRVAHVKEDKKRLPKAKALSEVKAFVQNVHNFRDDCIRDPKPPIEHVALFDEAQRAWDLAMTSDFMRRKKGLPGFSMSESQYLISCMDRHSDWAVIVCLVGGGQEINRGEAGIGEWLRALDQHFPNWRICISPKLTDSEYAAGGMLEAIKDRSNVSFIDSLHLAVSMRSFRAEKVSAFVKALLDIDIPIAQTLAKEIEPKFPIAITRDLETAKKWLRSHARGSERYGLIASSQAERLKPLAVNVKYKIDPVHWFLEAKADTRSSYYLEDVATEFDVQGLELDWACITWDADLRYTKDGWSHKRFRNKEWQTIHKLDMQAYQKNAYRVLLTRARQGMVIFIPMGDTADPTRSPKYYDATYAYLKSLGLFVL